MLSVSTKQFQRRIPRRKNRLSANYSGNEQGDEYGGPGEANLQKLSNVAI
jgi:hypothetical protein